MHSGMFAQSVPGVVCCAQQSFEARAVKRVTAHCGRYAARKRIARRGIRKSAVLDAMQGERYAPCENG
jgi:hypothetical protein